MYEEKKAETRKKKEGVPSTNFNALKKGVTKKLGIRILQSEPVFSHIQRVPVPVVFAVHGASVGERSGMRNPWGCQRYSYLDLPRGSVWIQGMVYGHPLSSMTRTLFGRSRYEMGFFFIKPDFFLRLILG